VAAAGDVAAAAAPPNDPVKASAGLYDDWPHDRSVFVGDDDSFAVGVNGDEHLEVCVRHNDSLLDAFNQVSATRVCAKRGWRQ
jgi:hypothetical protein